MRKELRDGFSVLLWIAFLFCLPHLQGVYAHSLTSVYPVYSPSIEWVSLSGYVNDTNMNPIDGATITVTCGVDSYMSTSDTQGYYYVGPLPLVYCLWNISFSKQGYKTIYVEMPIGDNITYDVILSSRSTIFVDDIPGEGPDNPPEDFTVIQDAINACNDGDTVFVYKGIYPEFISLNKRIILIGEKKESTIIGEDNQMMKHRISIDQNNVKIDGFTIRYSGIGCFGIYAKKNHFEISNNVIKNNGYGIWLSGTGIVSNNIIKENHVGIRSDSNKNFINNNLITNNDIALEIYGDSCTYIKNQLIDNSRGIKLSYASSNIVTENQFENSDTAITVSNSNDNEISKNNFINNIENTHLGKFSLLKDFKKIRKYKNGWDNNYWDDWKKIIPKPIRGRCSIYIVLLDFFPVHLWLPIAIYPFFEYDKRPAREPYDTGSNWQ